MTEICLQGLAGLRNLIPDPPSPGPVALGGGPEGDPYQIPSLMASLVVASEGWREINFGANLPARALIAAIERHQPRLVWISVSSERSVRGLLRSLNHIKYAASETGAAIAVGGRLWLTRGAPAGDNILHPLPGMEALTAFSRGLLAAIQYQYSG